MCEQPNPYFSAFPSEGDRSWVKSCPVMPTVLPGSHKSSLLLPWHRKGMFGTKVYNHVWKVAELICQ